MCGFQDEGIEIAGAVVHAHPQIFLLRQGIGVSIYQSPGNAKSNPPASNMGLDLSPNTAIGAEDLKGLQRGHSFPTLTMLKIGGRRKLSLHHSGVKATMQAEGDYSLPLE